MTPDEEMHRDNAHRAHDRESDRYDKVTEATIAAGQIAIRTAVLINGGAAVSVLAFIGALASRDKVDIALIRDVAAVAPNARTGVANGPAVTGFASIINAGSATAFSCSIGLPGNTPAPGSRRPVLHYQRTNAQNVPIGSQDAPVDITAGATQSFVFSITPAFEGTWSQDIALVFRCFNTAAAPSIPGLNTFLVSISNTAITDMLSIADTPTHDGIADIPGTTGTGLIVTAAVNIGAAGSVVFTPSDTPVGQVPRNLPVNLSICQTNPTSGACVNPATPGASSTVTVAANQTVTFSVFIQGKGTPIPFDPANSRVFIIGTQGATPVGEAGAAIRTQ